MKFDNLIFPGPPNRYLTHMSTGKTQDLSQKTIFWKGILSITLDTQNTLFVNNG